MLDRYILAKTHDLVADVEAAMDAYDLPGAAMEIQAFIGAGNNWYIRRSRDRFWGTGSGAGTAGDGADRSGLDTLYTVLVTLMRVTAPLPPMITEEIWTG
ncbi:MAG: class I tRNA ligase family protein [Acidimicrobiales bacterium]